jgi:hypothetical protein
MDFCTATAVDTATEGTPRPRPAPPAAEDAVWAFDEHPTVSNALRQARTGQIAVVVTLETSLWGHADRITQGAQMGTAASCFIIGHRQNRPTVM